MQKLMFIIDEGIGGKELLSLYGDNYKKLDESLNNIYSGLLPLKQKYEVVLLIYPTHHYREGGYGGDASDPLNRVSPALKHAFEYFTAKGMNIYLEIHSSGIYTNQNGELGDLALSPLHYGDSARYKSLPMDMETVTALKERYGDVFEGLRFHELVGSHEIGLHDEEMGRAKSHAFVVKDVVMRTIIDTVKNNKLQLVWGDHSFNLVVEQPEKFGCFKTWLDYAVDNLGKEYLTLNWANNGWPMHKYITGEFAFKNYRGVNTGMSVQSWFWQESDSSTMTFLKEGKWDIKWYAYAEMECPTELMAMYTLKYFNDGCTLVQYEPSHYIFNFYRPGKTLTKYEGNVEEAADYSVRHSAKRLFNMLLNGVQFDIEPKNYYDTDREKFVNNYEDSGAKRYYQNTLAASDLVKARYFDVYNNDYSKVLEDSEYRYLDKFIKGAKFIGRTHQGYSGIDDMFSIDCNNALTMFNMRNGVILKDSKIFKGLDLKGVASLNLKTDYVSCLDGDSDELIAFYEQEGEIKYKAFKAKGSGCSLERKFKFKKLDSDLSDFLPVISAKDLVAVLPIRTRCSVLSDSSRPLDAGIVAVNNCEGGFKFAAKINGKNYSKIIKGYGSALSACTVDFDGDYADELAVSFKTESGYKVVLFDLFTGEASKKAIELGKFCPQILFSQRTAYNQKAFKPVFGNLDNALIN